MMKEILRFVMIEDMEFVRSLMAIQIYETGEFSPIRELQASASVRAFEWHPRDACAFVVGATNGDILKIQLSRESVSDGGIPCH